MKMEIKLRGEVCVGGVLGNKACPGRTVGVGGGVGWGGGDCGLVCVLCHGGGGLVVVREGLFGFFVIGGGEI